MFNSSSFNQPINNWNVSKVTDMGGLFTNGSFNRPINNWDVSKVTDMNNMFYGSSFNQDVGNWNVSAVTNMTQMFTLGALTYINYNRLLTGWTGWVGGVATKSVKSGVTFGTDAPYTLEAQAPREYLTSTLTGKSWTISDGGLCTPPFC